VEYNHPPQTKRWPVTDDLPVQVNYRFLPTIILPVMTSKIIMIKMVFRLNGKPFMVRSI